jgi:hypothetical protein
MFTIEIGQTVVDRITGFKGVVTGRADFITGCNRYQVQPRVKEDGTYVESQWYDEHILVVDTSVPRLNVVREKPAAVKNGAYGSDPR